MSKYSLKRTKRPKALFGIDGGISAAATLAAAVMQAEATRKAAKQQADAVTAQAETQAKSLKLQSDNNTQLQKENINFTRQENQLNRQQQQDIQLTLQMIAGQDNLNQRNERTKMAVKYGGSPKRKLRNVTPFYGGSVLPFKVTDGGGALPIATDDLGYGLYELFGNDHEHYHKTKGGKHKSGVGIKFPDGSVVEGEGNQNTSRGELLYVTPNDAMFISKHSIDGFNPAKAVSKGMAPEDAFYIQEGLKAQKGINNNGSKTPVKKYSLKCGGRHKAAGGFWSNYGGATLVTGGNLLGSIVGLVGNNRASHTLQHAYTDAGNLLAEAYRNMKGIDMSELRREDYSPAHAMAVVSSTDVNTNPQLQYVNRLADAEKNLINRNTLSSAARQQRLAGVNSRLNQKIGEIEANRHNEALRIAGANADRVTDVSKTNAELDSQAMKDYGAARLALLQYNNDIENSKIAGEAEALSNAMVQSAGAKAQFKLANATVLGNALTSSASAFGKAAEAVQERKANFENALIGADMSRKVEAVAIKGDKTYARSLLDTVNNAIDSGTLSGDELDKHLKWKAQLEGVLQKPVRKLSIKTPSNTISNYQYKDGIILV